MELALEEKAIKLVSKRQKSKPEKSSEKPAKKANPSSAQAPTFQPPWYSPAPVFHPPVPSPFPPTLAPIPQPRPYRQYRPSALSYPAPPQFQNYGSSAFSNFPPMAPSAPFAAQSRGPSPFSGACYQCHQFGHRSSECPHSQSISDASNAGRFIS